MLLPLWPGLVEWPPEAHDARGACRSFQGFTCLLQISTRTRDFVVDAIALRRPLRAALATPLADASVVKVIHGADSDILWLQKDLGLFVVGLFDTGQAARVLGLPAGLGALLQELFNVKARMRVCSVSLFCATSSHWQLDAGLLAMLFGKRAPRCETCAAPRCAG